MPCQSLEGMLVWQSYIPEQTSPLPPVVALPSEAYLEPNRTSTTELFCDNS